LEDQYWKEDGFFDRMSINSIIITDDDDDEDDDDSDDDDEYDSVQEDADEDWLEVRGVPSALMRVTMTEPEEEGVDVDGVIQLEDDEGCDLESEVFDAEAEIGRFMEQGPPPKRQRKTKCTE